MGWPWDVDGSAIHSWVQHSNVARQPGGQEALRCGCCQNAQLPGRMLIARCKLGSHQHRGCAAAASCTGGSGKAATTGGCLPHRNFGLLRGAGLRRGCVHGINDILHQLRVEGKRDC